MKTVWLTILPFLLAATPVPDALYPPGAKRPAKPLLSPKHAASLSGKAMVRSVPRSAPKIVIPPQLRLKLVWDWEPNLTWNVWLSDDLHGFSLYRTVTTNECLVPSDNPHLFFTVDAVNTNGLSSYPWLLQ